jgi:hypothetical protein
MTDNNRFYGYLLIDLHTGIMDGMYSSLSLAQAVQRDLNEDYEGSNFAIFEGVSDPGEFEGIFPPDHLFHANVALKLKGETIQ